MSFAIPHPHEPKARYRPVADSTGRKLSEAPPPVSIGSPSVMWPVARCETKMSQHNPVASTGCGTRLCASELNATTLPFAEIAGSMLSRFAPSPLGFSLTRIVWPVDVVCTNTSVWPSVSFATRLVASERNATTSPSAEIDGVKLAPFACVPSEATLTSRVVPVWRSRTKTSDSPLASFGTRLSAHDENATYRPSAEADGQLLFADVSPPPAATLTRTVVPWAAQAAGARLAPAAQIATTTTTRAMRRPRFPPCIPPSYHPVWSWEKSAVGFGRERSSWDRGGRASRGVGTIGAARGVLPAPAGGPPEGPRPPEVAPPRQARPPP